MSMPDTYVPTAVALRHVSLAALLLRPDSAAYARYVACTPHEARKYLLDVALANYTRAEPLAYRVEAGLRLDPRDLASFAL